MVSAILRKLGSNVQSILFFVFEALFFDSCTEKELQALIEHAQLSVDQYAIVAIMGCQSSGFSRFVRYLPGGFAHLRFFSFFRSNGRL
jgi:hypothetical protein